jgi:hypothetical protein
MKPEFTKGEWKVRLFDGRTQIYCGNKRIVGDLYDEGHEPTLKEVDANAHLMAASPKMYEALQMAKEVMEISQVIHAMLPECGKEPYLKVLAAIAEAEGK